MGMVVAPKSLDMESWKQILFVPYLLYPSLQQLASLKNKRNNYARTMLANFEDCAQRVDFFLLPTEP